MGLYHYATIAHEERTMFQPRSVSHSNRMVGTPAEPHAPVARREPSPLNHSTTPALNGSPYLEPLARMCSRRPQQHADDSRATLVMSPHPLRAWGAPTPLLTPNGNRFALPAMASPEASLRLMSPLSITQPSTPSTSPTPSQLRRSHPPAPSPILQHLAEPFAPLEPPPRERPTAHERETGTHAQPPYLVPPPAPGPRSPELQSLLGCLTSIEPMEHVNISDMSETEKMQHHQIMFARMQIIQALVSAAIDLIKSMASGIESAARPSH